MTNPQSAALSPVRETFDSVPLEPRAGQPGSNESRHAFENGHIATKHVAEKQFVVQDGDEDDTSVASPINAHGYVYEDPGSQALNGGGGPIKNGFDSSQSPPNLRALAQSPHIPDRRPSRPSLPSLPSPDITGSGSSVPPSAIDSDAALRRFSGESQSRYQRLRGFSDLPPSPVSPIGQAVNGAPESDRRRNRNLTIDTSGHALLDSTSPSSQRPSNLQRALSTPAASRAASTPRKSEKGRAGSTSHEPDRPKTDKAKLRPSINTGRSLPSPMPQSFPLPPMSIPTYLQLELSSQRPSNHYIHRSATNDFPYESSRVKIERLLNFLFLPMHLEGVLWFGMLACLDSWLYTFTILPLRLLKSFYILAQSWSTNLVKEVQFVSAFIYTGSGRMWRRRGRSVADRKPSGSEPGSAKIKGDIAAPGPTRRLRHHRRSKSVPSNLMPDDKADILKGLLILCTCTILLRFDASRMYHWIRGQAAIKLYVIYNVLEVCDRLFSALGQDVLECLFSREALERKPDGHSKVLRPFWLFMLALAYTIIHSTALFYQVITLNVAVNSYSNALITLLLSNQFVEIKSTVFKKFEKENLFQLTCADVVERFQLWHMLVIIASRNIAETGGLGRGFGSIKSAAAVTPVSALKNNVTLTQAAPPLSVSSILPLSFTMVPDMVASITSYVPTVSHVLGPFLVVLGSEMLVDWLKHAYINKFNNTRPAIYDRFLDVLAKDYYTNSFGDQNLTKRLGLPVIPLSCLLIRASVQTYYMAVAVWAPAPSTSSTSLASIHEQYTSSLGSSPPSTTAAIASTLDSLLGGIPSALANSNVTTHLTAALIVIIAFLVLLAMKLVLGMVLLSFSRNRYRSMKEREKEPIYHVEGGRRVGGWGVVEVDEDKRRWIYDDDAGGLRALQEREERDKMKRDREREKGVGVDSFDKVKRYEMIAKRIW
ncbi:uncharacterized protein HMPREF1541_05362 [Cyphellophora europaea CBS 101466]|uniref:Cytomegalovirus gH-receptor family protein n=1 Tax=Cyphellophora europaea (strain CBS 101466) TaxID=1220924 RepID=W2RTU2_CYPE1|nr:uncharacterized protein HMPREF1541_05362 [Cyphellophora europaea CBS 101466]ETN39139.1 hypothetical protein HMPREF1541_05362 [Cyphellophora europaea CBS 101466]